MCDAVQAKQLLTADETLTCVLCRDGAVYESRKSGIAPMIDFLDAGYDLRGFCAADRIVGKAAALLFVLAGVKSVYAEVLSEEGLRVLNARGISVAYVTLTPYIVNRKGDGPCPMERAVQKVEDPQAAYAAIRQTLVDLRMGKQ